MKMRPESPNRWDADAYARKQLRDRHQDLESLESEYQSIGMTMSEYRSCRRSLSQAIKELETIFPDRGERTDASTESKKSVTELPRNRGK